MARLLSEKEALEYCDYHSHLRNKRVYQESIHNVWGKGEMIFIERIKPDSDFNTADIVGYGKTNRLWLGRPTKKQRENTSWVN